MRNRMTRIENVITKIFIVMAIGLFAVLSYYSFFYSYMENNFPEELLENTKDSIGIHIVTFALLAVLLSLLTYYKTYITDRVCKICFVVVLAASTLFSFYWISCRLWIPDADQSAVVLIADMVFQKDYSSFTGIGYANTFQQQWGIIHFLEILFKIFQKDEYYALIYINALMVPVIIASGYALTGKLSGQNGNAKIIYLVIASLCIPMYGYVPFVYGEIISTAIIMVTSVLFLQILEKFSIWKTVLASFLLGFAIQMRMNVLIYLIAVVLVFGILCITRREWNLAIVIVAVLFCSWGCKEYVRMQYESYQEEDSKGLPSELWIAMGLHESDLGAGWYDGSNTGTYLWVCNRDQQMAKRVAKEDITTKLQYMIEHPSYGVDFFRRKFNSQWNNPTYQFLGMQKIGYEDSKGLVQNIYGEEGRKNISNFMNEYQMIVYTGVLMMLCFGLFKKLSLEHYLLLITVFGGALFSLLWEAKARYIFPYLIFMLPYAAVGLQKAEMLWRWKRNEKLSE